METTTITTRSDDCVTIVEALKRLGNQAPTRPSFDAAVKKGKIREVTDKANNPDGKKMVVWPSVLAYMERGGFKQCGKSGATSRCEPVAAHGSTAPESPASSTGDVCHETDSPQPATPESPPTRPGPDKNGNSIGQPPIKPRPAQIPVNSAGKRKHATSQNCTTLKAEAKTTEDTNTKGRRNPPLRVIKNSLRHLDFEESKNVRDWLDNRLLTVLRSTVPMVTHSAPDTMPQA